CGDAVAVADGGDAVRRRGPVGGCFAVGGGVSSKPEIAVGAGGDAAPVAGVVVAVLGGGPRGRDFADAEVIGKPEVAVGAGGDARRGYGGDGGLGEGPRGRHFGDLVGLRAVLGKPEGAGGAGGEAHAAAAPGGRRL